MKPVRRFSMTLLSAALAIMSPGRAVADTVGDALNARAMYGINRSNGNLVRYDFATAAMTTIGPVKDANNVVLTGIDAAAYFPGFVHVYALWAGPDGKNKLVYVDVVTGKATVVATDVEGGQFTGATGAATPTNPWTVFAVQAAKVKPPATITGLISINPTNSSSNQFSCTRANGTTFTRDHLHDKDAVVDANGTYYEGAASAFFVKPKGNGNQNGLNINGVAYPLQNSNTYSFSGDMQVRVYNDNLSGGKAMGHWWIQVISGTVTINGEVEILTPNRIASVDQKTGVVNEIMPLSRSYSGLATSDGVIFYAAAGADLYKIDTLLMTETKVNAMPLAHVSDFEFADTYMMGYDRTQTVMAPVNTATGATLASPVNYAMGALGPIFFTPVSTDPKFAPLGSFD